MWKIKHNEELILTGDINGSGEKRSRLNSRVVYRKPQQQQWLMEV